MLFQGEEYGERAPFLFFSDHIDEEIADGDARGAPERVRGLRLVRRAGPRPAGPGHLRRAPSSRARASPTGLRDVVAAALGLRAELAVHPEAEAEVDGRRLTVRRGPYRIVANFGEERWPLDGEVVLAAGDVRDGALGPLAGAVVR